MTHGFSRAVAGLRSLLTLRHNALRLKPQSSPFITLGLYYGTGDIVPLENSLFSSNYSFLVWAEPVSWENSIHCVIPFSSTHFLHLECSDLKIVTDLEPFWGLLSSWRFSRTAEISKKLKNETRISQHHCSWFCNPLTALTATVPSKRLMTSQILWGLWPRTARLLFFF